MRETKYFILYAYRITIPPQKPALLQPLFSGSSANDQILKAALPQVFQSGRMEKNTDCYTGRADSARGIQQNPRP
jgi:hypothetical protein